MLGISNSLGLHRFFPYICEYGQPICPCQPMVATRSWCTLVMVRTIQQLQRTADSVILKASFEGRGLCKGPQSRRVAMGSPTRLLR